MREPSRWTEDEMLRLAARGVLKIDLLGIRGTTLVTCDELEAMAAVIVLSDVIPPDLLTPKNMERGEVT